MVQALALALGGFFSILSCRHSNHLCTFITPERFERESLWLQLARELQ